MMILWYKNDDFKYKSVILNTKFIICNTNFICHIGPFSANKSTNACARQMVILKTKSIILNTKSIILNTKSIILNTQFIVVNTQFIVVNTQFIMFSITFITCAPFGTPIIDRSSSNRYVPFAPTGALASSRITGIMMSPPSCFRTKSTPKSAEFSTKSSPKDELQKQQGGFDINSRHFIGRVGGVGSGPRRAFFVPAIREIYQSPACIDKADSSRERSINRRHVYTKQTASSTHRMHQLSPVSYLQSARDLSSAGTSLYIQRSVATYPKNLQPGMVWQEVKQPATPFSLSEPSTSPWSTQRNIHRFEYKIHHF